MRHGQTVRVLITLCALPGCVIPGCVTSGWAQNTLSAVPAPIAMAADRVSDSYRIYSSLIPLGEMRMKQWPHDLWLVQDATITVVAPNQPCAPPQSAKELSRFSWDMNPHIGVKPPMDQQENYVEIMQDFDLRCHDRLRLDPHSWNLSAPVHLLTPDQQKEFETTKFGKKSNAANAAKYQGAAALYAFSQVYFNHRHTVALVYATHWCGNVCGQGFWVALALKDGAWKSLPWSSTSWIS